MKQRSLKLPKIIAIIPARYASTRFPAKPLAKISGKTLIQRTYENTLRCPILSDVIVATDHLSIFSHVKEFNGKAVMTSPSCVTGTDRIIEALKLSSEHSNAEIVINVQGDEPCIDPHVIQGIAEVLLQDKNCVMSTAIAKLNSEEEALSSSVVKCVIDLKGYALYFSRSLIPSGRKATFHPDVTYYKHIGIYGYRREFLMHYGELSQTPLQLAEDLEQLKVLEYGYRIKTLLVEHESIGVDTPEDIKKVEQYLCKPNTFLSQEGSAHP